MTTVVTPRFNMTSEKHAHRVRLDETQSTSFDRDASADTETRSGDQVSSSSSEKHKKTHRANETGKTTKAAKKKNSENKGAVAGDRTEPILKRKKSHQPSGAPKHVHFPESIDHPKTITPPSTNANGDESHEQHSQKRGRLSLAVTVVAPDSTATANGHHHHSAHTASLAARANKTLAPTAEEDAADTDQETVHTDDDDSTDVEAPRKSHSDSSDSSDESDYSDSSEDDKVHTAGGGGEEENGDHDTEQDDTDDDDDEEEETDLHAQRTAKIAGSKKNTPNNTAAAASSMSKNKARASSADLATASGSSLKRSNSTFLGTPNKKQRPSAQPLLSLASSLFPGPSGPQEHGILVSREFVAATLQRVVAPARPVAASPVPSLPFGNYPNHATTKRMIQAHKPPVKATSRQARAIQHTAQLWIVDLLTAADAIRESEGRKTIVSRDVEAVQRTGLNLSAIDSSLISKILNLQDDDARQNEDYITQTLSSMLARHVSKR